MARRRIQQTDLLTNLLSQLGVIRRALWRLVVGRHSGRLNKERYHQHWQKIRALPDQRALLEADKLVDQAFQELGVVGQTFADRLRAAERQMSHETYQALWDAHKLRNQIAHELGYQLSHNVATKALQDFERALRALRAL